MSDEFSRSYVTATRVPPAVLNLWTTTCKQEKCCHISERRQRLSQHRNGRLQPVTVEMLNWRTRPVSQSVNHSTNHIGRISVINGTQTVSTAISYSCAVWIRFAFPTGSRVAGPRGRAQSLNGVLYRRRTECWIAPRVRWADPRRSDQPLQ